MPTISSPGIGSGLDINSIVSQLVSLERQPIRLLQTSASKLETQLSSYGKLKSAISTLRDAAGKLTEAATWGVTSAKSSNTSVATATTGTNAAPGTYSMTVQGLAASQSLASGTYASATSAVGTGTLRIEVGSWNTDQTAFTPKTGSTAIDVVIGAGDNTLEKVRDKINAAGAGVTASIVNDVNGARLSLRATDSGLGNAFQITATVDDDSNPNDALGLSALAYNTTVKSATQTQAAANARATINGLSVETSSNTLTNVVDGLTITLGQVSASPVDITVTQDDEALKKSLTEFVDGYNAAITTLRDLTKYDSTGKTSGNLQGDRAATMLQGQLRNLAIGTFGASTVFTRLSEVGLEMQQDGTLKQNLTKVDSALKNLTELKKVFSNVDAAVADNEGFGHRLKKWGDAVLGADGTLTNGSNGIQSRIDSNKKRQTALELRVEQVEKRLRAQYTALDAKMGQLNGLSSYVSQQMAALSANKSK